MAGSFRVTLIVACCFLLTSCIFFKAEKPLNPRLLFSVGSQFLESANAVAMKGSIDYRDAVHDQSGSFQLIINDGDSLAFVIEGPLNIDVFRLLIVDKTAYFRDRESDSWVVSPDNDELFLKEYGIGNVSPDRLGYCLLPQFYLRRDLIFDVEKMTLSAIDYEFIIEPSQTETSFSLLDAESNLIVTYGRRRDLCGGYYPSSIEITSTDRDWRILLQIEKIRINPKISPGIWHREG